jgi:hypothetical protein
MFGMSNLEIVNFGKPSLECCEVWDYWGTRVFEGTYAECQEYIIENESDTNDETRIF